MCFLLSRICEKSWISSLGMTSMDARIGQTWGWGYICTSAHFNTPPLQNVQCKWKIFHAVNTGAFATKGIFMLYNENKIVFCFNHSLIWIIGRWKRCFCCLESAKRWFSSSSTTSMDARFSRNSGGQHLCILTTPTHPTHPQHPHSHPPTPTPTSPQTCDVDGKIFDTVKHSLICSKGYIFILYNENKCLALIIH